MTGAAAGLVATETGTGDLSLETWGAVTGQAGNGILVQDSATGSGNLAVNVHGGASASGTTLATINGNPTTQGFAAVRVQNLDSAN
ncbi:hypothetical protein ABTE05_19600, partial [Acinetobacter baumannii]